MINNNKQLKAALFDLDGTLFDTEGQYTVFWGEIGRKYNLGGIDFANKIKGSTLLRILEYFPGDELQKELIEQIDAYESTMHYEFITGALDFLHELKQNGIKCAVVTSSNETKMESVRKQMPEFDSLFDMVLTSEHFSASKPAPDCYLLGARLFGAELDECVVFEDAFNGLQAGMSAGIFTVGLATYNSVEAIKDKCNYVINDFTEINLAKLKKVMGK